MSLIPGRSARENEDWLRIASYLTRITGLSEADVQRILALKTAEELRFSEAAMRLGLATQSDIEAALSASVRMAEPVPTARPAAELVVASDSYHPHSERIRALRTELLLRQSGQDCNLFAVVSPGRGEGRSRLAAELAIACAQLGQATLLVDADLRRPRQHELFNAENAKGLADALALSEAPRMQTVHQLPKLALLTSGPRPGNPLELLSDALLGDLISGWRRRYKHIVLDTPPVSEFSDALAVASHAGAVLMLSRAQSTPLDAGRELLRRLSSTGARVLGSVMNHF